MLNLLILVALRYNCRPKCVKFSILWSIVRDQLDLALAK